MGRREERGVWLMEELISDGGERGGLLVCGIWKSDLLLVCVFVC